VVLPGSGAAQLHRRRPPSGALALRGPLARAVARGELAQHDRHGRHAGHQLRPRAQGEQRGHYLHAGGSRRAPDARRQRVGGRHGVRRPATEKGTHPPNTVQADIHYLGKS